MIPQFTAESALRRPGGYRATTAQRTESSGALVPHVPITRDRGGSGGDDEVLSFNPVQCPGCYVHRCGPFGLQTCLTCC